MTIYVQACAYEVPNISMGYSIIRIISMGYQITVLGYQFLEHKIEHFVEVLAHQLLALEQQESYIE